MILLDTHTWIWWIGRPQMLSVAARESIDTAMDHGEVLISCISTWEIALLVAKGRLALSTEVTDWVAASERAPFVRFIPVNNQIAARSVSLPGPLHSDPADRIIAATAIGMDVPIVTKDERLLSYPHVSSIW